MICENAVLALGLAGEEELEAVKRTALRVGELLKAFFAEQGLEHEHFTLEDGQRGGAVLVADQISPDTMRLWDEKGEPLDKDRFRKDLGGVEEAYREVLRRVLG